MWLELEHVCWNSNRWEETIEILYSSWRLTWISHFSRSCVSSNGINTVQQHDQHAWIEWLLTFCKSDSLVSSMRHAFVSKSAYTPLNSVHRHCQHGYCPHHYNISQSLYLFVYYEQGCQISNRLSMMATCCTTIILILFIHKQAQQKINYFTVWTRITHR